MSRLSLALSVLSGLLYALCFPKFELGWLLGWFCLIPLFWVLSQVKNNRQAFGFGWVAGFCGNLIIFYWIIIPVRMGGGNLALALAGWMMMCAFLGLFFGFFAWLAHPFFCVSPKPQTPKPFSFFLVPAAWVAAESLRSSPMAILGGFPWCLLGHAMCANRPLAQLVEIGGVALLSFLLVFVQFSFWRAWTRKSFKPAAPAGVLLGLSLLWCSQRFYYLEKFLRPSLSVAIVQGNIYQYDKWAAVKSETIIRGYREVTAGANALGSQAVIYPE